MTSANKVVRTVLLMLLAVSSSGLMLRAQTQDQPAAPAQDSAQMSAQKSATEPTVQPAPGPGRQLVHESKEAAGEEKDEMAEFKESASVRAIAKLTGLNLQRAYWLSVVLNFLIIAGVIVWAGRKFLPGIFRDRTATIQKAMQEAQKASAEARAKLAQIEERLAKLDVEIATMRASIEKEGMAEEARIQAAAQEDARKIVASAEQEIAAASKAARRQLTTYAADLAVALAQKQIHLDAGTDENLVRNFAAQLGTESGNPGKGGN